MPYDQTVDNVIETNSANCQEDYGVDCGSLRVNLYDSNGNPVPNLDVLITNDSIAPAISQPGTTDVNGRRLLSTLPQASGYEVFVNINSADLNGNGLADDLDNSDYGYARTYNTGETWTFNDNPATLISPNPDKLTVESGLITSITFIVDLTSDVALTAYEESRKEDVSVELNNYSNYILNRAVDNGGVLELADDPGGGKYFRGFASLSDIATNDTLLNWLWFEFDTINETSTEYVRARFYDNSASPAALIPDSELAGNSSGFTSSDIVDLSGLDTSIYNELYIRFELRGDTVNTPGLVSSSLYALVEGAPINNARLRLYGEKSPGYKSDEPEKQIAKYDMIIATDATGEMTAENLESDTYKARWRPRSGYSPIQTCPKAEGTFTLNPDEDLSIDSLWRDDSSAFDTLTVKVMAADGSTVYPGVTLSLDGDVLPRVGVTDPCGQHTFGDIVEGTHDLELSGPGITATTVSVTINDGWNEYVYSP